MPISTIATVEYTNLWQGMVRLRLRLPEVASVEPGQYLLIASESRHYASLLPKPMLISAYNSLSHTIDVLLNSEHPLQAYSIPSLPFRVLAPLGRAFKIDARARRAVLMGTSTGLGALVFLAHSCVKKGLETVVIALVDEHTMAMPSSYLPPEIEYIVAVAAELTTTKLEAVLESYITWTDALYLALPPSVLSGIMTFLRRRLFRIRKEYAQVLLVPSLLPCGIGVCDLCSIDMYRGTKRLCRDGLVFDLLTVV